MEQKIRNVNFDILKLISMFSIVILHALGHGGVLSYEGNVVDGLQIWFLEALSISAVNCYVLISGYFLVKSKFKLKKVFKLWFEAFVFGLLIFIFLIGFKIIPFSFVNLLKTFTPLMSRQYWFVTVYVILYILSPYINILLENLSKEQFRNFLISILFIFSFVPTLFNFSSFMDIYGGGTGISWFICLYCVGAYVRMYKNDFTKKNIYLLLFAFFTLISFFIGIIPFFTENLQIHHLFVVASQYYMNYCTIFVFLQSLFLFLWFLNIKPKISFKVKKICSALSTISLGVYLLHENEFIREWLWESVDLSMRITRAELTCLEILKVVLIIFLACLLISYIVYFCMNKLFDLLVLYQRKLFKTKE